MYTFFDYVYAKRLLEDHFERLLILLTSESIDGQKVKQSFGWFWLGRVFHRAK